MKVPFACLVFLLAVLPGVDAFADSFRTPNVPSGRELRRFAVKRRLPQDRERSFIRDDERTVSYDVRSSWVEKDGGRYLKVERIELKKAGHTRSWQFMFLTKGSKMKFVSYDQVERGPDGRFLGREFGRPWSGEKALPSPLVHPMATSDALRGNQFKEGLTWTFYNWTPQTEEIHKINARVVALDKLNLPAGNFSAWRVALEVDLDDLLGKWRGLEFFIKRFVPKFTVWFADTKTSPMIKFHGRFGSGKSAFIEEHYLKEQIR